MILENSQSIAYVGGSLTATWLNAATRLVIAVYGFGQNFGSTIRRLVNHSKC